MIEGQLRHASTSDACQVRPRQNADQRFTAIGQSCIVNGCTKLVDLDYRQPVGLSRPVHNLQRGADVWVCASNPIEAMTVVNATKIKPHQYSGHWVYVFRRRLIRCRLISGRWLITSSHTPILSGRRFVLQKQRGYGSASRSMPRALRLPFQGVWRSTLTSKRSGEINTSAAV